MPQQKTSQWREANIPARWHARSKLTSHKTTNGNTSQQQPPQQKQRKKEVQQLKSWIDTTYHKCHLPLPYKWTTSQSHTCHNKKTCQWRAATPNIPARWHARSKLTSHKTTNGNTSQQQLPQQKKQKKVQQLKSWIDTTYHKCHLTLPYKRTKSFYTNTVFDPVY